MTVYVLRLIHKQLNKDRDRWLNYECLCSLKSYKT